jgi:hypothetical protein
MRPAAGLAECGLLLLCQPLLLRGAMATAASSAVPTLEAMAGLWLDLTRPASPHVNASFLDLPIVANFHGSVGCSPNGLWQGRSPGGAHQGGLRPVDMFAINSLEIPPFAGCGNSRAHGTIFGCGRMLVDGKHVEAAAVRYRADEIQRRSGDGSGGLRVSSATRMLFEQPGVMWEVNITNADSTAAAADVEFELPAMVNELAHVAWVQRLPFDPSNYTFTKLGGGLHGVLSVGKAALATASTRPAASLFAFPRVGEDEDAPEITLPLGSTSSSVPRALFRRFTVLPRASRTIKIIMTIAATAKQAQALASSAAGTGQAFDASWSAAHSKWEARWQSAFNHSDSFFSGAAPILELQGPVPGSMTSAVSRVYYASVLSIVSQMRTNLPKMYGKVWPTSQGSNEPLSQGGVVIGGAISYYWDEALSSTLLALLEPGGRVPTLQAWMTSDLKGKLHNWFDLDCGNPIGTVYGACNFTGNNGATIASDHTASPLQDGAAVGKLGKFYPYNVWSYGANIFNYLRTSNDSNFLSQLAGQSNLTVDQNLEEIVLDWQAEVIEGTRLADYGGNLDGFSVTYQHVIPGMQGNNIWMTRQLARLRHLQGDRTKASALRNEAAAMAAETVATMFASSRDREHAWFNVIHPAASGTKPLRSNEMRHVVDFFSMIFGLCGVKTNSAEGDVSSPCISLSVQKREQLSRFFHQELATVDWIRATSPQCNCSHSFAVPDDVMTSGEWSAQAPRPSRGADDASWPGLVSCKANREDHGTTGAYSAWPALAAEALCYLEGNCSSAFRVMASFAPNTYQGAFGQANAVPQLQTPPYTPFNSEPSFKPNDRRYLNMAVGAFADAVVRGFFGYHPDAVWATGFTQQALDGQLLNPRGDRGFRGSLKNVRTPFGLATITSGPRGLSIALNKM